MEKQVWTARELWCQGLQWFEQVQDLDGEERIFELTQLWQNQFGDRPGNSLESWNQTIPDQQAQALREQILQRAQGYPLQYLLGSWEFYGYEFLVGKGVLIPRPDTECLIEAVHSRAKSPKVIVDLCSGSGCIAITLAHLYSQAQVYAVELSPQALEYLRRNVRLHHLEERVHVLAADARTSLDVPRTDLLVSNPPYVTEEEMEHLQKEVQFEPAMALQAPEEGLHFYRCFLEQCPVPLAEDALVAFEIGYQQGPQVRTLFEKNGYHSVEVLQDYGGRDRVVLGWREAQKDGV